MRVNVVQVLLFRRRQEIDDLTVVLLVWEHTSLHPFIKMLDQHVASLMEETRRTNRRKAESMSASIAHSQHILTARVSFSQSAVVTILRSHRLLIDPCCSIVRLYSTHV